MFEMENDDRIRGLDQTSTAPAMAFAHDFILEVLLTREMIDLEAAARSSPACWSSDGNAAMAMAPKT